MIQAISFLLLAALSNPTFAEPLEAELEEATQVLQGLNQKTFESCPQCDFEQKSGNLRCPKRKIYNLLAQDKDKNRCTQPIPPAQQTSPENLEKFLSAYPDSKLGAQPDLITGKTCLGPQVPAEDRRTGAARYYYLMNRLKAGSLATIETLAGVNSLLGRSMDDVGCMDPTSSEIQSWCSKLQKCAKAPIEPVVAPLRQAVADLGRIKAELAEIRRNPAKTVAFKDSKRSELSSAQQQRIAQLDKGTEEILSINPMLRSESFKPILESGGDAKKIEDATYKQLWINRSALINQLARYRNAAACLNPSMHTDTSRCAGFEQTIQETPERQRTLPGEKRNPAVESYLDVAECRWNVNRANSEFNKIALQAGADVALTLSGFGAEFALARALASGSKALKGASLFRKAVMGADGGVAGAASQEALLMCDKEYESLEQPATRSSSTGPACPAASSSTGPNAVAGMKSCTMAATMAGLGMLTGVPFTPALVKTIFKGVAKNASEVASSVVDGAKLARSTTKIKNLSKVDFGDEAYKAATEKMKKQVDTWIADAEKAGDQTRVAVLKSHQTHLQNLEKDIEKHAAELAKEGYSVERVRAAVYTHDIGKFVPPDSVVANRYAFRSFVKSDPASRAKAVGMLQKQGMTDEQAEAFIRSAASEEGSAASILARRPDIKEKLIDPVTNLVRPEMRDFFAEFMDHAETSRRWLAQNPIFAAVPGQQDNLSRQLALDSVGHDGPSAQGSFWGTMYPLITGRKYPNPKTNAGQALRLVDRADQSRLEFATDGTLVGGPRKIAVQEATKKVNPRSQGDAIFEGLNSVPEGTAKQIDQLRAEAAKTGRRLAAGIDKDIEKSVNEIRRLRNDTRIYGREIVDQKGAKLGTASRPEGAPADAVGHVEVNGKRHYFRNIDEFFGTQQGQGAAAIWFRANPK